jgi:hypothetical protein
VRAAESAGHYCKTANQQTRANLLQLRARKHDEPAAFALARQSTADGQCERGLVKHQKAPEVNVFLWVGMGLVNNPSQKAPTATGHADYPTHSEILRHADGVCSSLFDSFRIHSQTMRKGKP